MLSITINTFVDKIFYINLDRDVERNQNMINQFAKYGITNYERFSAIIPSEEEANRYNFFGPYNHDVAECDKETCDKCRKYRIGSAGCLLSHKRVIEIAKERGYNRIAILEDDAVFREGINEKFAEYIGRFTKDIGYWNILYLGMEHSENNVKVNDYLTRIDKGGHCAYGYIMNSNIYDYILLNIDYAKIEIDLLYNNLNMKSAIHSYLFTDKLVGFSEEFESNIS